MSPYPIILGGKPVRSQAVLKGGIPFPFLFVGRFDTRCSLCLSEVLRRRRDEIAPPWKSHGPGASRSIAHQSLPDRVRVRKREFHHAASWVEGAVNQRIPIPEIQQLAAPFDHLLPQLGFQVG